MVDLRGSCGVQPNSLASCQAISRLSADGASLYACVCKLPNCGIPSRSYTERSYPCRRWGRLRDSRLGACHDCPVRYQRRQAPSLEYWLYSYCRLCKSIHQRWCALVERREIADLRAKISTMRSPSICHHGTPDWAMRPHVTPSRSSEGFHKAIFARTLH